MANLYDVEIRNRKIENLAYFYNYDSSSNVSKKTLKNLMQKEYFLEILPFTFSIPKTT